MTRLSVNINKIATLRNSRGGNVPDLLKVAQTYKALVLRALPFIQGRINATSATMTP